MPVAWGTVRGRVVFDSSLHPLFMERQSAGFSWTGTRSLLLTDQPAVYVHDTGGLGTPVVTALDPAADPDATIELVDASTRLVADLRLPQGRTIQLTSGELDQPALTALTGLRGRLMPGAAATDFISPCAISITLAYESAPDGSAPEELAAYVVVAGGRLQLRSRGDIPIEWPVNRVTVTPVGPSAVTLRGGALLGGHFLTGATLHLVTPQVRQAFMAVMGSAGPGPRTVGTSAPVTLRGLNGGGDGKADCVLSAHELEFQSPDTQEVLAHFDLGDPRLRIAGTVERFVVFSPAHGPVTVECASEVFGRRLYQNAELRAAAERTLTSGVLPAELADGRPVACAFAPDGMRVKGAGVNLRIPYQSIRTVEGRPGLPRAAVRLTTERTELEVVAAPELVQALHIEVRAWSNACAEPARVPGMLRAAVGLEEDYLLYTVFGPFYELHAALLGDVGADGLSQEVTLPEEAEERSRVAAVLQVGLGELQAHLDQVASVLPAFLRHRDARLLAAVTNGAEPDWLKAQEGRLRAALAPVQRAAAETGQLAGRLSRVMDLDPDALPKVGYAAAALSLGAAALLNPVFAVSGISQAYSSHAQGEQRKAQVTAQAERGWAIVLDRWNALVATTLPVLGYVLTENVFGLRWETARRIGQELAAAPEAARPAVLRAVARRLAILDVMRRYPGGTGVRLRRGEIADHLRAAREAVRTPRFLDF
ncbi:hypothetical protein SAMN05444920_103656 [Nonomuraea solani]|uniref:Uncharacterized protein n=1 Tax=Nonomuraea solani TaxID=1144553 RepID=A0A1H6BUT8_9ACTN|nr:hypothetical protein [Nonomuraea solani]SEG64215.1 hypothetical protein SAMN05444920_103656 [Nonomuraea solani]